jgi:hypothetical protein
LGNRELFQDLYIYDKWNFNKYPVIKISFGGDLRSEEAIKNTILSILDDNQQRLEIESKNIDNFAIYFKDMIKNSYQKHKQKVVVLIDEYDKPILDNLDQIEVGLKAKEILKSFYTILKESDEYLKFVFLTGVTKFSKVSIFSGLNNLEDITLYKKYSTICGYTQNDLDTSFSSYLDGADMQKVREWYNGYNFNGESVYNPFDILLFIKNEFTLKNYWLSTGTPSFLIKLLQQNSYFIPRLENLKTDERLIDSFDIENIALETILFQSGYLTIDKIKVNDFEALDYYLKIPNKEVAISFNDMIIRFLTNNNNPLLIKTDIFRSLRDANLKKFKKTLVSLFASIPYNNYVKNRIANYEGYYASVIYAYIASSGIEIIPEDITNIGRIDLTIKLAQNIFILEFKVGNDDAIKQIKEKNYHQKYLNEDKDIYLIGINFDEEERNIKYFQWEKVLNHNLPNPQLVKHVATQVDGKGGGRADMAQGGGNNPAKLSGW